MNLSPKAILSVLVDDTALNMMKLIDGKALTAQQISTLLEIPLSSTYRKLGKLEQLQIIKKTKIVRKLDGSDESFFTLWIDEISLRYKNNSLSCNMRQKSIEDKIVRLWQKFKV